MGVSKFAIVLIALGVCQTNGILYQTFDWTYLLNAVRSGNYSIEEFVENVEIASKNLSPSSTNLNGLYTPDCKIIWKCGAQITEVIQILHTAQPLKSTKYDILLQFKFSIDIKTLLNLKLSMNRTKLSLPGGKYYTHFTLPDDTICEELEYVTRSHWEVLINASTWFSPDSVKNIIDVGFGYNEDLIDCDNLDPIIRISPYFLTSMNFGEPPGVVESFGMFKRKIDYLHADNMKFVKTAHSPSTNFINPFIDYYPTPGSLGDEYHRLLYIFWKRYVTNRGNKMGAITPMPLIQTKPPEVVPIPLATYIDDESCYLSGADSWYAPSAWDAISKIFNAAVLTYVEWKSLSNRTQTNYGVINKTINYSRPHLSLIIDFSDWLVKNGVSSELTGCSYNWTEIESALSSLNKISAYPPIANARVTTLIFPVENPTAENYQVKVDSRLIEQIPSQLIVGCGFHQNSFEALNKTTAFAVVGACKAVNGSLYVLRLRFKLRASTGVVEGSSFLYEEVVRPELEDMKVFRNKILELHPQATVFFQLQLELLLKEESATVFCSSEALSLHEYIEAIVTWATITGVPLIVGRAFDDIEDRLYQTWFSILKPVAEDLKEVHPYFVHRNYPQIFTGLVTEPCLKWSVERPTIAEFYFHNNHLGVEFRRPNIRKVSPISTKKYGILLQFILHRFDLRGNYGVG